MHIHLHVLVLALCVINGIHCFLPRGAYTNKIDMASFNFLKI